MPRPAVREISLRMLPASLVVRKPVGSVTGSVRGTGSDDGSGPVAGCGVDAVATRGTAAMRAATMRASKTIHLWRALGRVVLGLSICTWFACLSEVGGALRKYVSSVSPITQYYRVCLTSPTPSSQPDTLVVMRSADSLKTVAVTK